MAVTPVGNPYVESSDLVANYPGASEALAERIDIVGVNPFANAAARDAAIPSPVQGQMCSLNDDNKGYRYDGSEWILFSGAGPANFTNTATGTYTDGGIDYKYITFTGSGELIVDQAGFADILVVAGGGGSETYGPYNTGGGAGGVLELTNAYLPAGTLTVTVGAGGTILASGSSNSGNDSVLGTFVAVGGGGGGGTSDDSTLAAGCTGGSGAGGSGVSRNSGPAVTNQGNIGGNVASGNAAGGGAGSAASGSTPGNPKSSSMTGTAVNYSKGGSNSSGTTPNTANSGNGGGGAANGNSGTVIIRVRTN